MAIDPAQLLRRLEPAVRPAGPGRAHASEPPFERRGFGELLALVSSGSVASGRSVELGGAAKQPLDGAQLHRLARAADTAEAAGARRAVMLIDGRGLVMDIATRTITEELSAKDGASLVNLDAAVYVASPDEAQAARPLALPGSGMVPPAVAQQLEDARQALSSQTNSHTTDRPQRAQARKTG